MPNIRAFRNGNWSNVSGPSSPWWNGTAVWPPSANDEVYANGFTVVLDQNVNVVRLDNRDFTTPIAFPDGSSSTVAQGGTFILNDNITINASSIGTTGASYGTSLLNYIITFSGSNFANINATTITGGGFRAGFAINHIGSGILNVTTTLIRGHEGSSGTTIDIGSTGLESNINILTNRIIGGTFLPGNVQGNDVITFNNNSKGNIIANTITPSVLNDGTRGRGIVFNSRNILNIYATIQGGNGFSSFAPAILHAGTGLINVFGDIIGVISPGITINSGALYVRGNIINMGSAGINSTSTQCYVEIDGSLIYSDSGGVPVFARTYFYKPTNINNYIRYSGPGQSNEDNFYTYQFTQNAFSNFSIPPVSSVRLGVSFTNNNITGTCVIPPASGVAFGVQYDTLGNRLGTAVNINNIVFNTLLSALTTNNSIGEKLKKTATIESIGHVIASFSN